VSRAELLQIIAALLGAVASIIAAAEVRLIKRFKNANASAEDSATTFPKLLPIVRWRLRRLLLSGVVSQTEDGRLYLDEIRYSLLRKHRRNRTLTVVGVFVATIAVIYLALG
jgi:hypothetical protein